jgi:gamma-glutamylcyclotransferase (GGCT)/AIG2-like uncharacterized protein YtfP
MHNLTDQLPLFVYGTLLPDQQNYPRYLAGTIIAEVPATVKGELWWNVAEDYPYLCPGDHTVDGRLITIAADIFPKTISRIDALEDFIPDDPMASLYLRQPVEVQSELGTQLAWSYFWNRPERPGIRLSSGDFRTRFHCSEG